MGVAAIILAAGLGTRMPGEKLHLSYQQTSIINRVLTTVSIVNFAEKLVVTNDSRIAGKAAALGIQAVPNPTAAQGQSTSLIQGIKAASPTATGYLFILGDQPLLSSSTLEKLLAEFREFPASIIQPLYGETPGSPVLFPATLQSELLALGGDVGGRKVLAAHPEFLRSVSIPDRRELLDIDTWEDYQLLQSTGELYE